jgi:sugar phosphate permease
MVAALYGAVFLMAQYLQTVLGASPLVTGVELLPWTATPLLIAPGAGAAADRLGARPLLAAGLALQALGLAWVGLEAGVGTSYGALVPGLIVAGVGVSMGLPAAQSVVIGAVPPAAVGKASGINSTARQLGGVFGIAVAVAVFAGAGSLASPHAFADGFTPALLASAGLSVLGCVAALVLPGARPVREVAMAPAAS